MSIQRAFTPWRAVILALVTTGALVASASAAVSELTIDPVAQLSPGQLHATLTGTVTCDTGTTAFLTGQIVQSKNASGLGSTSVACDGTQQAYSIDVSSGGIFGPAAAFKPGKAKAQVSTSQCDPVTWMCTSKYTDATIRLAK
jgi:2-methylaconitate cis-trans-isomerase PrpF